MKYAEANVIIHERIMRKCWHKWERVLGKYCCHICTKCGEEIQSGSMVTPSGGPNYCKDANCAVLLLEKLDTCSVYFQNGNWNCEFEYDYKLPHYREGKSFCIVSVMAGLFTLDIIGKVLVD